MKHDTCNLDIWGVHLTGKFSVFLYYVTGSDALHGVTYYVSKSASHNLLKSPWLPIVLSFSTMTYSKSLNLEAIVQMLHYKL